MRTSRSLPARPLAHSLARFSSAAAMLAALALAGSGRSEAQTPAIWQGDSASGLPGDGFLWTTPTNWTSGVTNDVLPQQIDSLTFGNGTVGTIVLNGNQAADSLTFNKSFTVGAYGSSNILDVGSGFVTLQQNQLVTFNAIYKSVMGLNLAGSGTLYLTNPKNNLGGSQITVDGTGTQNGESTTLMVNLGGLYPQVGGTGAITTVGRQDGQTLGASNVTRVVNLQNGGELKIIGPGGNPDGGTIAINLSGGNGAINVTSTYQQLNIDDAANGAIPPQITGIGDLVKNGKGRLTLTSQDYNLVGNATINGGILEFGRLQGGSTTANTRFSSFSGTTNGISNTLTINGGGAIMLNNGTAGNLDFGTIIANDGAILGIQGQDQGFGMLTGGNTLQINGTVNALSRDLFGVQTQRFMRINSDLTGSGTLQIYGSTNAGGTPRLVLQRTSANSTFDGTFRLMENAALEVNPRANGTVDVGNLLAGGDIEFAGWGGQLDVRNSDPSAATLLDYTKNDILATTTQVGNLNRITINRSTVATGTGHAMNFGSLTLGNHRLAVEGANSYQLAFSKTASIKGNAVIEMRTAPMLLENAAAISEDAAGRSLTFIKTGVGNAAAQDVTSGGVISISNLQVATGTLNLRGANGSIGSAFGGAPATITINGGGGTSFTNGLPTFGKINLDSNGSALGIAGANNNNRIADNAVINMRSNSVLQLTSANGAQTTETVGTVNVSGHGQFDIAKTGTAPAPVALTINSLNLTGTKPTVNFTGTSLGVAGANTSRIVLASQTSSSTFLGAQYHQNNEWAKYDSTIDNGVAIGVTPFTSADYVIDTAETDWAVGQNIKRSASGVTLSANRAADTLNLQFSTANQAINTNGFVLTVDKGGILTSTNTAGIIGNNGVGGLTAGSSGDLYVHTNAQLDIKVPITNNPGTDGVLGTADDIAVNFIKSGSSTVRLTHQSLGVGTGNQGGSVAPFTTAAWTSSMTGSWIINDGILDVHRGQFLNGRPVILNGGTLNINEPVSTANANTVLGNWNNNVTVNGNAVIGSDDNGESADAGVGGNSLVKLGSLTVNNGSILGLGAYNGDIAFMGGATFNGRATLNLGLARGNTTNNVHILSGAITGDGFDVVTYGSNPNALIIGGGSIDNANNTFTSPVVVYATTVRLNKANGAIAIPDTAASEDLVINGGTVAWGPGHHGDLSTTNNNPNLTNNGLVGLVPTSPASALLAGQDQIADTATVTLLAGTLGESDRINNETWGTLIQKNGTLNVGLGKMEVGTVTVTGGAFNLNPGGTFKAGSLNLQVGAYSPNVTTGLPGDSSKMSTLEIGAGGLTMTGQTITLGGGSNGSIAGAGAVLKLGGNVTVSDDPLLGNAGNQGIFIQIGNSFRELGNSKMDLLGGNRTFTIDEDVQFFVTTPITNGGIVKSGGGALILQPHQSSNFAGAVVVNSGVLAARANGAFGTSAGGVTINSGGTVKLEGGWTYGDNFVVSGSGAIVPGTTNVREIGALVSETGRNHIQGTVALAGDATIASNGTINPSATPAGASYQFWASEFMLENAAGITGAGTLTLSGSGDGTIAGGVNTTSGGLNKDGSGRWIIPVASSYTGPTVISAGHLQISNNAALGATSQGTTVYGGATLELVGGITLNEPLTINDGGADVRSGALSSIGGNNTYSAAITLGTDATISSSSGNLAITGNINSAAAPNSNRSLTLTGSSTGNVTGAIALGSGGLTKNGGGTWTLSGANTFTGATSITGGSLVLDYTTNNTNKISGTAPLTLGGGKLVVQGNAGANTTQTVAGLALTTGGGTIDVSNGAGRTATLNLGAISTPLDPITGLPVSGATVSFVLPQSGAITTSSPLTNGILGAYATVGQDWATKSGSNIVPFSAYVPLNVEGLGGANDNARLSSAQRLTGIVNANSLKLENGVSLALDFNSLSLASGGLIYNGSGGATASITGSGGAISGTNGDNELFIHTTGGVLDIGAAVIGFGAGSLTKTGPGTLFLRNNTGNGYSGSININGGTLAFNATASTHPTALGGQIGTRNININGATLRLVGGYDLNVVSGQQMQLVIGGSGATIQTEFGGTSGANGATDTNGTLVINDAGQLSGSGDIVFTGGGRYTVGQASTGFANYTGNVTVNGGVLNLFNTASIGGRAEQTITVKGNSALINQVGSGAGVTGLPNNLVLENGASLYVAGGNRAYTGDVQLSGTNNIVLVERDNVGQQREMHLMGHVSGSGVTMNVVGGNNANPVYISNSSNDFTGAINLGTNAALEARQMGALGQAAGAVTVNLSGANSRLLLRQWQNADFLANVVVGNTAEINSDRLVNYGAGSGQLLSINNLTVNGGDLLQFGGGNSYVTQVKGTATFNATPILNVPGNVLFENGMHYTVANSSLDKRGGGSVILRGPADHTGTTLIQAGLVDLRGANGALPNTSKVELRGGELRIENGDAINNNRLNDSAAVVLGGGTLRINGDETFANNTTAVAGNTVIVFNPGSETVTSAITLGSFSRSVGATLQIQAAENGGAAVGSTNLGNVRVSPRILIGGMSNVTGNSVVPGLFANNGFDFVQYDGTTMDGGQPLGVREMRNPGNTLSPSNYINDEAETGWTDTDIARLTGTTVTTLTANRALEAVKFEGGASPFRQIAFGSNTLRIETGGMITVGNETLLNGMDGKLTAGPATPGTGTAELFVHGNGGTIRIEPTIANNGTQPVALVKSGTGTLQLRNTTTVSSFTGGIYVNGGTLDITRGGNLGPSSNKIQLAGGTLNLNVPDSGVDVDLANFGHSVSVVANSTINLDNNGETAGTGSDNNFRMGSLTIDGPYTLAVRGFDSQDISFSSASLTGNPTIDLPQTNTAGNATTVTLGGALTGTGFMVSSTGNSANTAAVLQIGGTTATIPDTTANTYTGKLVLMNTFPGQQNQPTVQLNKAAGTNAITGDVEINAGQLNWLQDNQVADTGRITLNYGTVDLAGHNETIAGVTMRGGAFRTNAAGDTATSDSIVTITGDVDVTGATTTLGVSGTTAPYNAFEASSHTTLNILGTLRLNGYSRAAVGATAATLNLGGLEMTGTLLSQLSNVGGANIVRLNGNVTTLPAEIASSIGNSTDSDTYLELNGTRTFTVADGTPSVDLSVSTVVRNSTVAGDAVGGIIKNGPGMMQIQGGGTANSYTGPTTINEGAVVLFKNAGVNALGSGAVTVGDGVGGARADKLILRNSNQINDSAALTVSASGVLDLNTFNTSEQINSLAGSGFVDLGPNSTLTVSGLLDSVFSGVVSGGGGVTKAGAGKLDLSGANDYLGQTSVNEGTLVVKGSIGGVTVLPGAVLAPGTGAGLLNVRGGFDLQSGATLKIELGGTTPGTGYDRVNVTGGITLGGDLQGSLINGFAGSNDYFFILINDGTDPVIGTFNGLPEGALVDVSGQKLFITYQANFEGVPSLTGGNDIALVVPEPTAGVSLLMGVSSLLGLKRFRRRSKSV